MEIGDKSGPVWLDGGYENVSAVCPFCGNRNIFNRASDLKTFEGISGMDVACLGTSCSKPFRIIGETINPPFEMFFYDTEELYAMKRYMLCILSLAQAWEYFFATFLRLELVYKPYLVDEDLAKLNRELGKLYEESLSWTYGPLRNVFLRMQATPGSVTSVDELVAQFGQLRRPLPSVDSLAGIANTHRTLCERLFESKLGDLRNQVAHKNAQRPTREQVDLYLKETQEVLLPLGRALGVDGDDVNWYVYKNRRRGR